MKHITRRHIILLSAVLAVLAAISTLILSLSANIQDKMEKSAVSNIEGTVQLMSDSVSSIREDQINGIYRMASTIHMDNDLEPILSEGRETGGYSWAAVADASTGRGICHDGSPFRIADLNCEETALLGERSVSNAFVNSQGIWAYTVQCPIYEDNVLAGALYADISIEHVGELLPLSIYNGDGTMYILDVTTKRFILQPVSTSVHISAKYDLAGFLSDFGDVDDTLEEGIYQAIGQGKKQIMQIQLDGAASYLFFWPVNQSGWYLCGIVPEAGIRQESIAVGHTIQLTMLISFLAAAPFSRGFLPVSVKWC